MNVKVQYNLVWAVSYLMNGEQVRGNRFVEGFNAIHGKWLKHSINETQLNHEPMLTEG